MEGLLSMTGYGRARIYREGRDLLVELKAVNHRFLDISLRVPRAVAFLEEPLRACAACSTLKRGHVDVTVTYRNDREDARTVTIDRELLQRCAGETRAVAEALHSPPPTVAELLALCGALAVAQAEENAEAVTALALEAFGHALADLTAMRVQEGAALAADLAQNLSLAERLEAEVEALAPAAPVAYRERLTARLAEWGAQGADPQRLAQEVALMADRCAIDEELSRLKSHFAQFRLCLGEGGEAGRRMDFLLQEMNRETNTIGSKAADAQVARRVVDIKCLLEKLREQAQNVV